VLEKIYQTALENQKNEDFITQAKITAEDIYKTSNPSTTKFLFFKSEAEKIKDLFEKIMKLEMPIRQVEFYKNSIVQEPEYLNTPYKLAYLEDLKKQTMLEKDQIQNLLVMNNNQNDKNLKKQFAELKNKFIAVRDLIEERRNLQKLY